MSSSRKMVFGVLGVVILAFLALQLVPVAARTNPPVHTQIQWDSPQTASLVQSACYDCHSNETKWPWYAYIAPISWLVAKDVQEGRESLNFSELSANQIEAEELVEKIREGAMPPSNYLALHPEARLSKDQQAELIAGLKASLTGKEGGGGERSESGDKDD